MKAHITELEYVDERSNSSKFYRVFDLGDVVTTQYGRIGTFGTFTPRKKDNAEKKVAGKLAKGYNVVASGTVEFTNDPSDSDLDAACSQIGRGGVAGMPTEREQSSVVVATNTGATVDPEIQVTVNQALELIAKRQDLPAPTNPTRPMLAQEIRDGATIESMLADPAWNAQMKLDGDRVVVEVVDGVVSALNRSGQPKVKNVGAAMLAPFANLTEGRWVFDGEVVDRTLHLFDMPAAGAYHDEAAPFLTRYQHLKVVASMLGIGPLYESTAVKLVPTAEHDDDKRTLFDAAVDGGKEGVIFRLVTGTYESGKRSTVLVKHKFLNDADCFVSAVSNGGKESVELSVFNNGTEQVVGSASTIGKTPAPKMHDVWEVRFLYVVSPDHPRMVQPRLMRLRTDKEAAECSIEQFAGAVTDKTVD